MKKLIVIDGNSLLFRAYYATAFNGEIMHTKDGFPTNAIFGFNNMIMKLVSSLKEGDLFFVSFDTGHKTFRHEEMETYKAQRKPVDEALIKQFKPAREYLDALNAFHYELDGYEGDDLAGTVAKMGSRENLDVEIYTSDKDYLQLIDDHIAIQMIRKGLKDIVRYDAATLKETMGLEPDQIRDYKGLMGDPSDNIKGIPGIGEKTALKLLSEYHDLENIIANMQNNSSKLAQKIIENQELGRFCKKIATIDIDVKLPFSLNDLVYKGYDFNALSTFYTKYEFFSLLKKLKPSSLYKENPTSVKLEKNFIEVENFSAIPSDCTTFYLTSNVTNYHHGEIQEIVLSNGKEIYHLPFNSNDIDLKRYLEDANLLKSTYDVKRAYCLLNRYGIKLDGIDLDFLLASYLLDSSLDNDIVALSAFYGENIASNDEKEKEYLLTKVIYNHRDEIFEKLKSINCLSLYQTLELPLSKVLAKMEIEGFPLNKEALSIINDKYLAIEKSLEKQIYDIAGYDFNLSSPKQVADLLFNKLGLPGNKKNSTSIEVLNALKDRHPIVKLIIDQRKYSKLISTYTSALSDYIFPDGKIHTLFNQALTTTGRLSSSEPNLQNITVRDEDGKYIRKAFFYDEDDLYLLSLDYSQIELRLLAEMSSCQTLIDIFNHGGDIHASTARKVFNIPDDQEVPSALRRKAKAVNFGIVYGISDWGLAEQIDCSVSEAKVIIDSFYKIYPEIKEYFDRILEEAKKTNYVVTMFNRRRYIKELASDNYQTREFGRRAAKNAPIQGTAADLIKIAMIKIDQALTENKLKSRLVLQIHDELIFKVYEDEKDQVYSLAKEIMEHVINSKVKLVVDGGIAKTWYDTK